MKYKKLGNTGIKVSAIGAGCWGMGGKGWGGVDKAASIRALHTLIDQGVNLIDTAPGYGRGLSEEIVGEALRGIRDQVLITTKCGMNIDKPGFAVKNGRRDDIIRGTENSLRRLGTGQVDILLLHWPDENTPLQETMEAMQTLKQQGKARLIGVCNLPVDQMKEATKYADIAVTQLPFSMVSRSSEEIIRWAHQNGYGTMTYGSLGAGILSGKIREHQVYGEDDMRGRFYPFFNEPQFSQVMRLLPYMDKMAEKRNVSVAQVAINWAIQKEFVDTALVGVRTVEHAKENCEAMTWELTADEIALLDEKTKSLWE